MADTKVSSWFRPVVSVQNICLLGAGCFIVALFDLNKSELASWVQAVGSIAAIYAAFLIGNKQTKLQNQIRDKEVVAKAAAFYFIVKNAVNGARSFASILQSNDPGLALLNWKFIHYDLIRNAKNSMSQIPSYQLGSYELVDSFHQICGSIDSIVAKAQIKIVGDKFDKAGFQILQQDIARQWNLCEANWDRFKAASELIHGPIDT